MKINAISSYRPILKTKNVQKQNHINTNSLKESNTVNFTGWLDRCIAKKIKIDPQKVALASISIEGYCNRGSDFPIPNKLLKKTTELLGKEIMVDKRFPDLRKDPNDKVINTNVVSDVQHISNQAMYKTLIDLLQPVMDTPAEDVIDSHFGKNTYNRLKNRFKNEDTAKKAVSDYFLIKNDILYDKISGKDYFSDTIMDFATHLSDLCDYQLADPEKAHIYPKKSIPYYQDTKNFNERTQRLILDALISSQDNKTLVEAFENNYSKQLDVYEENNNLQNVELKECDKLLLLV